MIDRKEFIEKQNKDLLNSHKESVWDSALISILIYILLEITFEGCMYFCSFYDWRKLNESLSEVELKSKLTNAGIAPNLSPNNDGELAALKAEVENLKRQQNKIPYTGEYFNNNYIVPPNYYKPNPNQRPIGFFKNDNNHSDPISSVVLEKHVPQISTNDIIETNNIIKKHIVDIKGLKRDISTYYPRCFMARDGINGGAARESTAQKNRIKVNGWIDELKGFGWEAKVNMEAYEPIEYYELKEAIA